MRKRYFVEIREAKSEMIVRGFLLQKSSSVRLTAVKWKECTFLLFCEKKGGDEDPAFVRVKEEMKESFEKRITSTTQYGDPEKSKWKKYDYHYYSLTPELKKRIEEATILWNVSPPEDTLFYGFEDPAFLGKEEMIGEVISHESYVFLYLTPIERRSLEKKGVKLILK